MTSISIKKFYPSAKRLKHFIKYFWVFENPGIITLAHNLLPVSNIDIIINFLSPITFEQNGIAYEPPGNIFFFGFKDKHILMKQHGAVLTIGTSFFPAGFYPFFRIPVSEFRDNIYGLDTILYRTAIEIEAKLKETDTISGKIELLEEFFLEQLDQAEGMPLDTYKLLGHFSSSGMNVEGFCLKNDIHPRKFERQFNKYIGTTPKLFSRISRFQTTLTNLTNKLPKNLTTLAHELEFYDQPHFINDFKSFTGSSPSKLLKEKKSLKQIVKNP